MKIKPAPGRAARHPSSFRLLAEEGEPVTLTPFWRRLISTGDVVVVDDTTPDHPAPVEGPNEEAGHAQ